MSNSHEKAEDLIKQSSQIPEKDLIKRRAFINVAKGHINYFFGKTELALICLNDVFSLKKELGNSNERYAFS